MRAVEQKKKGLMWELGMKELGRRTGVTPLKGMRGKQFRRKVPWQSKKKMSKEFALEEKEGEHLCDRLRYIGRQPGQ